MKQYFSIKAFFLLLLSIGCFWGLFYLQKNVLPQQIRAVQQNLNVPVRYAFLKDKTHKQLTVFDLYESAVIDTVDLAATADSMVISRVGGYIAYAKDNSNMIHLLQLEDLSQASIHVTKPVQQLSVHYGGQWLSYVTDKSVIVINRQGQQISQIPKTGLVSLTYHPDGGSVFITELETGSVSQYFFSTNKVNKIINTQGRISPVSIVPDGSAVVFNALKSDGNSGLVYFSLIDQTVQYLPLSVSLSRPYVSNDSRYLLALGKDTEGKGKLFQIDAQSMKLKQTYPTRSNSSDGEDYQRLPLLFTGWLGQVAAIVDDKIVDSYELDIADSQKQDNIPAKPISALVSSDSKTLLMGVEGIKQLWLFDMRTRAFKEPIDLAIEPKQILMGQTNTLCH